MWYLPFSQILLLPLSSCLSNHRESWFPVTIFHWIGFQIAPIVTKTSRYWTQLPPFTSISVTTCFLLRHPLCSSPYWNRFQFKLHQPFSRQSSQKVKICISTVNYCVSIHMLVCLYLYLTHPHARMQRSDGNVMGLCWKNTINDKCP